MLHVGIQSSASFSCCLEGSTGIRVFVMCDATHIAAQLKTLKPFLKLIFAIITVIDSGLVVYFLPTLLFFVVKAGSLVGSNQRVIVMFVLFDNLS